MIYKLRQNFISFFREKYVIKDINDNPCFLVKPDFKLLRSFSIFTTDEKLLLKIKKRYFRIFQRYDIFDDQGNLIAFAKRKPTFFTRRMKVYSNNKKLLYLIKGDILGWSFQIINKNNLIEANINKKIVALTDAYGVEVLEEQNTNILLAIAFILDTVYHRNRRTK